MRRRSPPRPEADWAFFFDIDGTLLEIAPTPATVEVHADLPSLIAALHAFSGGAVSLLTGRAIADVDEFLPLPGIPIAGQHGSEFRSTGNMIRTSSVMTGDMEAARSELEQVTRRYPGLLAEFKGNSIALHYRAVPRLGGHAHRLMRSVGARFLPELVIQKGKRVVELRPGSSDKGAALGKMMTTAPFKGRVPVFVGDDATDEAGFAVVNQLAGHSIKVGRGRTAARWRLRDVAAVRRWLQSAVDR